MRIKLTTFLVRDLITELLEPLWQERSKFLIISGGSGRRPRRGRSPPLPYFQTKLTPKGRKKFGGRPATLIAGRPSPYPVISRSGPALIIITPVMEDCMRDLLEDALHLAARTLLFTGIIQSSLMSFI